MGEKDQCSSKVKDSKCIVFKKYLEPSVVVVILVIAAIQN